MGNRKRAALFQRLNNNDISEIFSLVGIAAPFYVELPYGNSSSSLKSITKILEKEFNNCLNAERIVCYVNSQQNPAVVFPFLDGSLGEINAKGFVNEDHSDKTKMPSLAKEINLYIKSQKKTKNDLFLYRIPKTVDYELFHWFMKDKPIYFHYNGNKSIYYL